MMKRIELCLQYREMYDEKCYGVCPLVGRPILVLKDPSLVKQISVKDFHHFVDRNSEASLDAVMNYDLFIDRLWNRSIIFARGLSQKSLSR